jgi:hypothetical protein
VPSDKITICLLPRRFGLAMVLPKVYSESVWSIGYAIVHCQISAKKMLVVSESLPREGRKNGLPVKPIFGRPISSNKINERPEYQTYPDLIVSSALYESYSVTSIIFMIQSRDWSVVAYSKVA